MKTGQSNGRYPRPLHPLEESLITLVLPNDRPAYGQYRQDITQMSVIGQGRRGQGHLILGAAGAVADTDAPLSPVIAFGACEFPEDEVLVAVHEKSDGQIHAEIMPAHGDVLPVPGNEIRRWTYSSWSPGMASPRSQTPVREVVLSPTHTLVLAPADNRIWLHDSVTGMNQLIPITTLYGELMAVEKIRDPEIVRQPRRLFEEHSRYSDESLRKAFAAYNEIHPKTEIRAEVSGARKRRSSLLFRVLKFGLRQ